MLCIAETKLTAKVFLQLHFSRCDCPPGYGGTYCDEIIDHCLIGSLPKCQNNGSCESITGGFQCICQPGFEGKKCENGLSLSKFSITAVLNQ